MMSRPASSWSVIATIVASSYASAWSTLLKATRTSRPLSWSWNQCGRGYEPTIVVGRMVSTIFVGDILAPRLVRGFGARGSALGFALGVEAANGPGAMMMSSRGVKRCQAWVYTHACGGFARVRRDRGPQRPTRGVAARRIESRAQM